MPASSSPNVTAHAALRTRRATHSTTTVATMASAVRNGV